MEYGSKYFYETPVSFHAAANQRYWFSVQADLDDLPQWGRLGTAGRTGCSSAFRSTYFGFPDWTDVSEVTQEDWDASQEFVCWSAVGIQHLALDSTEKENVPFVVDAEITGYGFALDPNRIWIDYSVTSPHVWIQVDMEYAGEGHWRAAIPGQDQPKEVSYVIHAENVMGDVATAPSGGRDEAYAFDVAWLVVPFELSDGDFIVNPDGDDDATSGIWEHVYLDAGSSWVYEPDRDHTSLGSKCWITERGNAEVSSGKTTLQSRAYDLAGATTAKVKYWRWYYDHPYEHSDSMLVQVRNDGDPWIQVSGTPDRAVQWVQVEHDLYEIYGDDLGAVEIRFTVSEQGDPEIVEAAIDDLVILTDLEDISAIEDGAGNFPSIAIHGVNPNPFRSEATIQFETLVADRVFLTVHDVAGRLVATLIDGIEVDAGEHRTSWNGKTNQGVSAGNGIYYVKLQSGSFGAGRHLLLFK